MKISIYQKNYELNYWGLKSLHKRIVEVPEVLSKYDNFIKDQHEKGIIERVEKKSEEAERKHYIPYQAVFTLAKDTTKVCIVYDTSAKAKQSTSYS